MHACRDPTSNPLGHFGGGLRVENVREKGGDWSADLAALSCCEDYFLQLSHSELLIFDRFRNLRVATITATDDNSTTTSKLKVSGIGTSD